MQRRAQELAEDEVAPSLEALLGVRPAAMTAAIRRSGLAGLDVEQLLHAVRFAPDGAQHLATGTPRDPVGVLSWRLGLWGSFIAAVGVERAFTVRRELDERRAGIRARRAERAAEVAGQPMPVGFRELAGLRSSRT